MSKRMKLLEAVAEAARIAERFRQNGYDPWSDWCAFQSAGGVKKPLSALDALPVQPQGETVTLAVWEDTDDGEVQLLRPGEKGEQWAKVGGWRRLGAVTLPLNTEVGV